MIVFDLVCGQAHVFEAWFGSSEDYEGQRARDLVSCPLCGDADVRKAVMAPAVPAKGNARAVAPAVDGSSAPARMKALMAEMARVQARMLEGSEHVGRRFAEEARAIHAGDAPERVIHGQATIAEAKALVDEGVGVAPLPLPVVPPGASH